MKKLRLGLIGLFLILILCTSVNAKETSVTPLSAFTYELLSTGELLLTDYNATDKTVEIPAYYTFEGVQHPVLLASESVFFENAYIQQVTIGQGVGFARNTMGLLFAKCQQLRKVDIRALNTSQITDMSYMFYGCKNLQTLDLAGLQTENVTTMKSMFSGCQKLSQLNGYQLWDTSKLTDMAYMFEGTAAMKTVDLQNWTLASVENTAWCFQNSGAQQILLPEDMAIISAGSFNHVSKHTGNSFEIPAGVRAVGYAHTFYDFATEAFTEFTVAQGNTACTASDGILYSADMTKLLAVPRGKTFPDKTYHIPEGVNFLAELCFSRNTHVQTLVLPNSYVLMPVGLYDTAYILNKDTGNINAGMNLNIAVYLYTGIQRYAVKPDNPNYKSVDGVIYTKDMTTLMAVPTCYAGYMQIPEGVTTWHGDAMWCGGKRINELMKNCTGVSIPSTLTVIGASQVEKLNWLVKNVPDFRIALDKRNPVYQLDADGLLKQKPPIDQLEITLEPAGFTYDGTPKQPQVRLAYKGKALREHEDYTLEFIDNLNAGVAYVRITAISQFQGTAVKSFIIDKAQPAYTAPKTLSAVYGQLLQDIRLPKGFSWMTPDAVVGQAGEHDFLLSYYNNDSNYYEVFNIPVTVSVLPKPLEITAQLPGFVWQGKAVTPTVPVTDGQQAVDPAEYTVTYENNTFIGKGTLIITDVAGGNYAVSGQISFMILPDPLLVYWTVVACLTLAAGITGRCTKGKKGEH